MTRKPCVGDRVLYFSDKYDARSNPGGLSPFVATTDKDGRFELAGVGVGQIVTLRVRGPGVADKEIVTVNHDEFDPEPINKAVKDARTAVGDSGGSSWLLYRADPTVVLEPEKVIRGRVTDPDGKPRTGVPVTFTKTSLGSSTRTVERVPQRERKSRQAVRRGHPCFQPELHALHGRGLGTDEPKHSLSCYNLTRTRTHYDSGIWPPCH